MPMALGLGLGLPYIAAASGPYPALDLNFAAMAASGTLDSRVTYSGASLATLTDATGAIAYKPHNLLTYSEQFDNAAWIGIGSTVVVNGSVAPDGAQSADKSAASATTSWHGTRQAGVTLTIGVPTTMSVYAKASEETKIAISDFDVGTRGAVFDLSAKTAVVSGTDSGMAVSGETITDVRGGWFRCSLQMTASVASRKPMVYLRQFLTSYAGDGTSGVYVWGAQLNFGPLQPYYPTTGAAYHGPRFTYDPVTLSALGLLIEEQRTQLLLNSDIIGTNLSTQSVTVAAVSHTLSFYGTGTITLSGTSTGSLVGSGAYPTRSTLTFIPTAGTLTLTITGTVQYAQLEAGSFATSFIPSAGASVTRAASAGPITSTNFSAWYTALAAVGTFTVQGIRPPGAGTAWQVDDGTASNRMALRFDAAGAAFFTVVVGGATQADINAGSVSAGGAFKLAVRWGANDFAASLNGAAVVTDATGTVPTVDRARLGADTTATTLNSTLARVAAYAAKTNAQLVSLST